MTVVAAIVVRERTAHVRLHDALVISTIGALDEALLALAARRDLEEIRLDFAEVSRADSSAVAVVELARQSTAARIALDHLPAPIQAVFDSLGERPLVPLTELPRAPVLERLGGRIYSIARAIRAFGGLIASATRLSGAAALHRARLPSALVGGQVATMGAAAVGIVSLLGFLLGVSVAFQGALQLRRLGAAEYVAGLVGLSMVRELAPLMTAIVVTGRSGAAIAAELGTMRARAEIDALATMGINPVRYLVVPRLIGLTIAMPVLTLAGTFAGLAGGAVVCDLVLRMSPQAYWWHISSALDVSDFARGFAKSIAFAWIIGLSGAHLGMRARRDAGGVGFATTRAVVTAVFWIIVFDAAFESIATLVSA